jgi:hypothetical protein
MSLRIQSSIPTATTTTTSQGRTQLPTPIAAHPMSILLFGKRPPRLVDRRRYPKLKKTMRKLEEVTDQVASMLHRPPGSFSLELCEGGNACISRDSQIAVGVELLEKHQDDDDLLVAILGHEIGHQPWTWPSHDLSRLSKKKRDALYREEEAKADWFAGRVLADLEADPESVCRFLEKAERFEAHKPSDYYPAKVRAAMITEAFEQRHQALEGSRTVRAEFAHRTRDLR